MSNAARMNPAATKMMTVLLSCGRVSVSSIGSTAHTLLLPSTSRYTPSMDRCERSSGGPCAATSAAESSRSVFRISEAEVFDPSEDCSAAAVVGAVGSASDCCAVVVSSPSAGVGTTSFVCCCSSAVEVMRGGKSVARRRALFNAW